MKSTPFTILGTAKGGGKRYLLLDWLGQPQQEADVSEVEREHYAAPGDVVGVSVVMVHFFPLCWSEFGLIAIW